MTETPRPPEGPDREALDYLRGRANAWQRMVGAAEPRIEQSYGRLLALLPTPPAPGDREGLRAEVERIVDEALGEGLTLVRVADLAAALAARDTDQGAGEALATLVDRWRPVTPTYHAVVAGEHLDACIACLMVAELDEVLPR
jgi:hypothetical protein